MSRAIAALGDAALLLPAWLLLSAALVLAGRARAAGAWSVAIVVGAGATLAAKLLFHACGAAMTELDVVSPSGHVSLATVFYGGLTVMIGVGRDHRWRVAGALACCVLLVLIGASRVRTGAHSAEEVLIGFAIGAAVTGLFAYVYLRSAQPPVPAWPLVACLIVAILALGGRHFSLEGTIGRTARQLATTLDVCGGGVVSLQAPRWRDGDG